LASWSVYLARCADGTLYCGIARDVALRIAMHDAGTGAKYTRSRGPLAVLLVRRCRDKGTALRLEHAIKQLPRAHKLALVERPSRVGALLRRREEVKRRRRAKRSVRRAVRHAVPARAGPARRVTLGA
jgi:putative endonuclease